MGQAAELAAAQNLLSSFSSPCFSVTIVSNFGLCSKKKLHLDTLTLPYASATYSPVDPRYMCNDNVYVALLLGSLPHGYTLTGVKLWRKV